MYLYSRKDSMGGGSFLAVPCLQREKRGRYRTKVDDKDDYLFSDVTCELN